MREMKDSGLKWVGQIPKNWRFEKGKYHFLCKKTIPGIQSYKYQRLALTLNGVIKRSKDDTEGLQPKDFNTYQLLRKNELVFKLIDLQNISTSRVGLAHDTGLVSPAYVVLHPNNDVYPQYIEKFYLSMWYREIFNALGDDGVRSNLNSNQLLNVMIPIPSYSEQKKIADFLEKKSSHMNDLRTDIEKQIEILEEYKKSVITEAVTKGLDQKVEMKDSGIEWIGKIPKDWITMKTLYSLSKPITDGPHTTPTLYDDGVMFVSAEAVSNGNGRIDFSRIRGYISYDFYKECCKKYKPEIGDVYMVKSGATTGRVAIVDTNEVFTIWSPLAVFRANTKIIKPEFLFYSLQSDYFQTQVQTSWSYGTQENIGMRVLEKIKIVVPPLRVQNMIIDYLDQKCSQIDLIISSKKEQIETLDNYKKSLIYEYVTGKKEVI